jgi:SPW repeat
VASTAFSQTSRTKAQPWVDWTNLTLGVFLAASPWLALEGDSAVMWNAAACGAIIATAAGVALSKPSGGAEWTNVGIGLWLLIAPWVLGFSLNLKAMWTSLPVCFGVAFLAGFQLPLPNRAKRA